VFAAKAPPVSMELIRGPEWSVLLQGEAFPFELEIRNTGMVSWTEQTTQLELEPGTLGINRWLPVEGSILPGKRAVFTDTLATLYQPGLYTDQINWQIVYKDKAYPGQSIEAVAIVLPEELAAKRGELEEMLPGWKNLPTQQVQAQLEAWVEEQSGSSLPTVETVETEPAEAVDVEGEIRPVDAILIPLLMLPIVLILGFILTRRHSEN
jgi:hypothetical protein